MNKLTVIACSLLAVFTDILGSNTEIFIDEKELIEATIDEQATTYLNPQQVQDPDYTPITAETITFFNKRYDNASHILAGKFFSDIELNYLKRDGSIDYAHTNVGTFDINKLLIDHYPHMIQETTAAIAHIKLRCYTGELMACEKTYHHLLTKVTQEEYETRFTKLYSPEAQNREIIATSKQFATMVLALLNAQKHYQKMRSFISMPTAQQFHS